MLQGINDTTALIIGIGSALVILAGAYKVLWRGKGDKGSENYKPGWAKGILLDLRALRDAILGRDAVRDSITNEVKIPPLPGIGMRMAHQEAMSLEQSERLAELTRALTTLVDQGRRLDEHDGRLAALESAAVERVVSKAESAAAWRAMEAATLAKPDDEPTE